MPDSNSRLGFLYRLPQKPPLSSTNRDKSHPQEGDKEGKTHYDASAPLVKRRNSNKTHKYTGSRRCGSKLGKDCSTRLQTCTFRAGFWEWFWISCILDGRGVQRGSYLNAGCRWDERLCDWRIIILCVLLSSHGSFWFWNMEPIRHYVCPKARSAHNTRRTNRSFFVLPDNL